MGNSSIITKITDFFKRNSKADIDSQANEPPSSSNLSDQLQDIFQQATIEIPKGA